MIQIKKEIQHQLLFFQLIHSLKVIERDVVKYNVSKKTLTF